jgi:RimJ/RimL family protein N-acetyltransferase
VRTSNILDAVAYRVHLRPVIEDDLAMLDILANDPDATRPYNWFGWRDRGHFRRRWLDDGLLTANEGVLIVVRGEDHIGFVSWSDVRTAMSSRCWRIGINILPEQRGQGYGTEAQRLLVRYLFAHTQVNRIEADTEVSNIAEQRSLEKAGFSREGVLRGYGFRNGRWRDGVLYSILRDEVDLDSED